MSQETNTAKNAAEAKKKAEADKKADADAKAKADAAKKPKRVRVICDGTLGPKLLEKGAVTDDPEYVALLEIKGQKKVEEVK